MHIQCTFSKCLMHTQARPQLSKGKGDGLPQGGPGRAVLATRLRAHDDREPASADVGHAPVAPHLQIVPCGGQLQAEPAGREGRERGRGREGREGEQGR